MRRLLALPVLLLPLLAGCGGDDDTLSKAEFIAAGDALCHEFETAAGELEQPETPAQLAELLGEAIRLTRELRAGFAELEPPDDGVEVQEAFLAAIDGTIEKAEEAQTAAADEDVATAEARFNEADQAAQSADDELAGYGFEDCAEAE